MTGHHETILQAAAAIMRDDALSRVTTAKSREQREVVNAALLASIYVERYLEVLDELERPF